MQKQCTVSIGRDTFVYTVRKRKGQRNMALSVRADGTITLSVPWWVTMGVAERYVQDKRDWLTKTLASVPVHARVSKEESDAHYKKYKEVARALVEKRLHELNMHYNFSWGRVAIRKNRSCWGSCSSKKNLNFDYRIVFLPPHLQDYLLVHELCHLKEMNHGKRFWALVAHVVPNHLDCRKELRAIHK